MGTKRNKKYLTAREVAEKMGIDRSRVYVKYKSGHFPNAIFCPCGHSILIPAEDVELEVKYRDEARKLAAHLRKRSTRPRVGRNRHLNDLYE
jgi:hypothetical protein